MISDVSPDVMYAAVAELKQALFHHEQWCEALYTTLICRLPPDQRDMEPEAHRKCRFGQWYYGPGCVKLRHYRGFEEIAMEHHRMHQHAATLLMKATNSESFSLQEYEHFDSSLRRMRLEINTLRHDIEEALHNLDPVTGAANRTGMLSRLREEHELVKRKVHSCCVAMMDIDHFKKINDEYGHAVGDRVLITIARYTLTNLRPYDKLFRYGGEEFLLCLADADLLVGQSVVERLRMELASIPYESNAGSFYVTVSIGLTLLDADISVEQSIDRADKGLYFAKSAGRDRTSVWDCSMT